MSHMSSPCAVRQHDVAFFLGYPYVDLHVHPLKCYNSSPTISLVARVPFSSFSVLVRGILLEWKSSFSMFLHFVWLLAMYVGAFLAHCLFACISGLTWC
jgi:hypothetical protein